MHWRFRSAWTQATDEQSILMPSVSSENLAASSMAIRVVRLQQRGPPISERRSRMRAVSFIGMPQASLFSGFDPVTMLAKMPAPICAPQTPQAPQTPPGTFLER